MSSEEYLRMAYELALWRELRSRLSSISAAAKDGKTDIVAMEAPYIDRFVTLSVTSKLLDDLLAKEFALRSEMALWKWVRRPDTSESEGGTTKSATEARRRR